METVIQKNHQYDFQKDLAYVLSMLNFGPSVIQLLVNSYRNITDGPTTSFNYYHFGCLFTNLRRSVYTSLSFQSETKLELNNALDRLEEYIVPAMYLNQKTIF